MTGNQRTYVRPPLVFKHYDPPHLNFRHYEPHDLGYRHYDSSSLGSRAYHPSYFTQNTPGNALYNFRRYISNDISGIFGIFGPFSERSQRRYGYGYEEDDGYGYGYGRSPIHYQPHYGRTTALSSGGVIGGFFDMLLGGGHHRGRGSERAVERPDEALVTGLHAKPKGLYYDPALDEPRGPHRGAPEAAEHKEERLARARAKAKEAIVERRVREHFQEKFGTNDSMSWAVDGATSAFMNSALHGKPKPISKGHK